MLGIFSVFIVMLDLLSNILFLPKLNLPKRFANSVFPLLRSMLNFLLLRRVQRLAMLENSTFHEQLLLIACAHAEPAVTGEASEEHRQKLALDILTWILAVHMNDPTK